MGCTGSKTIWIEDKGGPKSALTDSEPQQISTANQTKEDRPTTPMQETRSQRTDALHTDAQQADAQQSETQQTDTQKGDALQRDVQKTNDKQADVQQGGTDDNDNTDPHSRADETSDPSAAPTLTEDRAKKLVEKVQIPLPFIAPVTRKDKLPNAKTSVVSAVNSSSTTTTTMTTAERASRLTNSTTSSGWKILRSTFDSSVEIVVDDDSERAFGVNAFRRGHEDLEPEDTFWARKRALMETHKSVRHLDQHALKAPENLRASSPPIIVHYLTKVAKNNFQKFRVIFRWVAHAITHETDFRDLMRGRIHDNIAVAVLETGFADCVGYAKLLQYLCSIAAVPCEVVVGYNKNAVPGRAPCLHAWNRVKLDGYWFFADCTSACRKSETSCCPEKFREFEFLSEPRYFNSRRLPQPLGRYGKSSPYASVEQFAKQPTFGALASVCDLQILSHSVGVIETDEGNCVRVAMRSALPITTWPSLMSSTDYSENIEHIIQWWEEDILHVDVYLPRDGTWTLKIFGQLVCDKDKEESNPHAMYPSTIIDTGHCHLVTFNIVANSGTANLPMVAHDTGPCGISPASQEMKVINQTTPIVYAVEGKASVVFQIDNPNVKMVYRFFRLETHPKFISSRVYMERIGSRVIVHIFCPSPGSYILRLLVNRGGKEYHRQAEYIIEDNGATVGSRTMTFTKIMGYHTWGPNEHFADFGIKMSSGHESSTVLASEGEVRLEMSWPKSKDLFLSCSLMDMEAESRLQAGRVIISSKTTPKHSMTTTTFHIRMQQTGYFVLQVFARPKDTTGNKRIGGWLIVVKRKSTKPKFPAECLMSGPNDAFYKLGMKTKLTKLETIDGTGYIDVQYEAEQEKAFRYYVMSCNHDRYDSVVTMSTTTLRQHAVYVTSFQFDFPTPNVYAFRLMAVGDESEWHTIGTWAIVYDTGRRQQEGGKKSCKTK